MKPNEFAKEFKKSYDFKDTTISIDAADQKAAEESVDPEFMNWLKNQVSELAVNDIAKCELASGTLTLSKEDSNLFQGHFADKAGQVICDLPTTTLEIIAKNLTVKNLTLLDSPEPLDLSEVEEQPQEESPKYLRIKMGDFELELKKSFMEKSKGFRDVRKGLEIFRKSTKERLSLNGDRETINEIVSNWDVHGERISQIFFAIEQMKKRNEA